MDAKHSAVNFVYFLLTLSGELTYNSENSTEYISIALKKMLPTMKHLSLENP